MERGNYKMKKYAGSGVFGGIAIGVISVYKKRERQVQKKHVEETEMEKERLNKAIEETEKQLVGLYEKALKEVGEADAAIFEAHKLLLIDNGYIESIEHIIDNQKVNAEYATATAADNFATLFAAMDDDYMRERAKDIKDVSDRLISVLSGEGTEIIGSNKPVIVVADDLLPSETVQMDKDKVISFVTRYGSSNSHTAILARAMNIPALVNVLLEAEYANEIDGKLAIVDGYTGELIIEPDKEVLEFYTEKRDEEIYKRKLLQELKGKENVTKDGRKIDIYANITGVADAISALKNDAAGIGLFRSEFLYLQSETYPTEEEQFTAYKTVAEVMAGKEVIIRTLDIGSDKQVSYFDLPKEDNPAMGYRAIRLCLQRPDVFKTQLRAILRASAYGNISLMLPMIISVSEIKSVKAILNEVKRELRDENIPYKDVKLGIMIETPAAAMISDLLAEEVDFFSIGTNDLAQYTLAIDRQNEKLAGFYEKHHPAVLRMIEMVVKNGHEKGLSVSICGELGADYALTKRFIDMGVDKLSVSPGLILGLREKVRSI